MDPLTANLRQFDLFSLGTPCNLLEDVEEIPNSSSTPYNLMTLTESCDLLDDEEGTPSIPKRSMQQQKQDDMSPATSSFPSPMSPVKSSSVEYRIVPKLQNIVATANFGCKLDLKDIANNANHVQYNPKRFSALIMRIREPRTTALIFSSGKMVCLGGKSEDQARIAARKFGRIIQKLGSEAKFSDFKIQNMVASCYVGFQISLFSFGLVNDYYVCYEPEIFPGLVYRMIKPRVVLLIFKSGKIIITGATVRSEIYEAFDNILPLLKNHKQKEGLVY